MLADKVARSIAIIREHRPGFVGISGGKDSLVCWSLAQEAGVECQPYYCVTGIDKPETVRYLKANFPGLIWLKPRTTFWQMLRKWGPPGRWCRWCCRHLKERPGAVLGGIHLVGIRADESRARRDRPVVDPRKHDVMLNAILDWTELDVWTYIEDRGLPYNPLYDKKGVHRVGCMACPFSSRAIRAEKVLYPWFYKKYETVAQQWFNGCQDRQTMAKYKTLDDYLNYRFDGFWSDGRQMRLDIGG